MDDLKEFQTSEKLGEFIKAFTKFQETHLSVKKDSTNPHFRSTYASLPAVIEATREDLILNGFCILQLPLGGVEVSRLLNRITHSSGEWVQWVFTTPLAKKDPQGSGSALTYSRRYNLTSSLGLAESDDDANNASGLNQPSQTGKPTPPSNNLSEPPKTASKVETRTGVGGPSMKQLGRLFAIAKSAGYEKSDVERYISDTWGLTSVNQLNFPQYNKLCGTNTEAGLLASHAISGRMAAEEPEFGSDGNPIPF